MKKAVLFRHIILFLVPVSLLIACESQSSFSSGAVSFDELQRHMEYLASDETEGRMTASAGYQKAADYVVRQFESYGLQPGWTDEENGKTFYQPVPFIRYRFGEDNSLFIRKEGESETLTQGRGRFQIFYPGEESVKIAPGNPVFVGFGIHEPELGWDDFDDLDITDRLAVVLAGFPDNPNRGPGIPWEVRRKYGDRRSWDFKRFLNVIEKGAAGIIAVPDTYIASNWDSIMSENRRINLVPAEAYGPSAPGETPVPSIMLHADLVDPL